MRVTFNDDGTDGIIHELLFSDTHTVEVGVVIPESSTGILALLGTLVLMRRKRS